MEQKEILKPSPSLSQGELSLQDTFKKAVQLYTYKQYKEAEVCFNAIGDKRPVSSLFLNLIQREINGRRQPSLSEISFEDRILQNLRNQAEGGHAESAYDLGCYFSAVQQPKAAVAWFYFAAKQKHVDAQYQLGLACLDPEIAKHYRTALHWFEQAAKRKHVDAQYYLDFLKRSNPNFYLQPKVDVSPPKSDVQSVAVLPAATQDSAPAKNKNEGTSDNSLSSSAGIDAASNQNTQQDKPAILSVLLEVSAVSNKDAPPVKQEPLAPASSVSSSGDQVKSISSHHLVLPQPPKPDYKAIQTLFAEGLALYCQAEYSEALARFEQVNYERFPVVCIYLSLLYQGVAGVSQEPQKSAYWLEEAKKYLGWFQQIEKKRQKTAEDHYFLGLYYQFLAGKDKRKQAVDCYKKAVNFVPAEANYRLGMYYVEKKNAAEAKIYLERAAAQNHKPAIAAREKLLQENPQLLLSNTTSSSANVGVSSSQDIESTDQEVATSSSSIDNAAASSHTTTSPIQVAVETNIQVEEVSSQQSDNLTVDAETPVARPTYVGLPSEANVEIVLQTEPAPVVAEAKITKPTISTKPKKPEDHFNDGRRFYEQGQPQNALASFLLAAEGNHKAAYPYVCELYVKRPGGIEKDDDKLKEYREKAIKNRKWFMDLKGKSSDKLRCLAHYYRYVEGNVEFADKYDNLAGQKQEKNKLAEEKASVAGMVDEMDGFVQSCSFEDKETSTKVNQSFEFFRERVLRELARIDKKERQAKLDAKAEAKAGEKINITTGRSVENTSAEVGGEEENTPLPLDLQKIINAEPDAVTLESIGRTDPEYAAYLRRECGAEIPIASTMSSSSSSLIPNASVNVDTVQSQAKFGDKEERNNHHLPPVKDLRGKVLQAMRAGNDKDARRYAMQGWEMVREMANQQRGNAPYPLQPNRAKKSGVPTLEVHDKQRFRDLYGDIAGQGFFSPTGIPVDNQSAQKVKSDDAKAEVEGSGKVGAKEKPSSVQAAFFNFSDFLNPSVPSAGGKDKSSSSSVLFGGQPVSFRTASIPSEISGEELMRHIFSQVRK